MNFNDTPTYSTPALTAEIAQEVYRLIKEFGNKNDAYTKKGNSEIDAEHFDLVDKEIDRIVGQINLYKSGSVVLDAEVSHFDDEGVKVIDSEAVYFTYTTDEALASAIASDYLDVATIINDIK